MIDSILKLKGCCLDKGVHYSALSARFFDNQVTESIIRCKAMNKMTHLGMPEYALI